MWKSKPKRPFHCPLTIPSIEIKYLMSTTLAITLFTFVNWFHGLPQYFRNKFGIRTPKPNKFLVLRDSKMKIKLIQTSDFYPIILSA